MIIKLVYLIFVKLKSMIAKDIFFFLILLVGVITCNLMFVFGYGIVMQINERDGTADFTLYNKNSNMGVSDFEKALSEYSAEIYYYLPLEMSKCSDAIKQDPSDIIRSVRTSHSIFKTNVTTGNINNLKQYGTVIAPKDIKSLKMGDVITLNGSDFLIVGSSVSDDFEVSVETFESSGFIPAVISVDVPAREVKSLATTLQEAFGTDYRIEERNKSGLDERSKGQLALIAAVYMLCIFAFMYLFVSIYDDASFELNVYEMLGATRLHIVVIVGGVMFVFLSMASLLSQAIHRIFYNGFFDKLNVINDYVYTFKDYLLMFIFTLISVYILVFIYIIVRTRRSTIACSRKFSH